MSSMIELLATVVSDIDGFPLEPLLVFVAPIGVVEEVPVYEVAEAITVPLPPYETTTLFEPLAGLTRYHVAKWPPAVEEAARLIDTPAYVTLVPVKPASVFTVKSVVLALFVFAKVSELVGEQLFATVVAYVFVSTEICDELELPLDVEVEVSSPSTDERNVASSRYRSSEPIVLALSMYGIESAHP